ncbi:MAG TPA: hypothetical protein G4O11_07510 [Anaerolineae bacterium]|nr:hypothetical protein [Anaerolineae bacterium]
MTDNLRLAKARQELLLKAAQLDRDISVQGKSEFLSLSKLALALSSVLAVAYGIICLVLV